MTNLLADATVSIPTSRLGLAADWDWQESASPGGIGDDAASPLSLGKKTRRCAFRLGLLSSRFSAIVIWSRTNAWYGSVDWRIASARCSSAGSLQLW